MSSNLKYNGTDHKVLPGDRVQINRLFRKHVLATVTYIPSLSTYDSSIGEDQWSYKVDGGDYYVTGYDPKTSPYTSKAIKLISRTDSTEKEKWQNFQAPPESVSDSSIASELLFIFLFVLSVIVVIAVITAGIKWIF